MLAAMCGCAGAHIEPWMQATLAELNKRLEAKGEEALPMNRFRGNVVVADSAPGEEDEWERFTIGHNVEVTAVKPCDRCKVSNFEDQRHLAQQHIRSRRVFIQELGRCISMTNSCGNSVACGISIVLKPQSSIHLPWCIRGACSTATELPIQLSLWN